MQARAKLKALSRLRSQAITSVILGAVTIRAIMLENVMPEPQGKKSA